MRANDGGAFVVRRAQNSDAAALIDIDSRATYDTARRTAIQRWCASDVVLMADGPLSPVGYSVLEYSFFGHGFVTMLMVSAAERRRGVGAALLAAVASACTTTKLFTSTNASNLPMQGLPLREGWHPVGLVHGLEKGDPELFYLCPGSSRQTRDLELPDSPS